MYTLIILFFASLVGIVIMIGRKLQPVRMGVIPESEHAHPFVPDLERARHVAYVNFKKYEHLALVTIVTLSVRFSKMVTSGYRALLAKIQGMRKPKADGAEAEENKFLGIITDYKHRIRHIKHKIKEEENENK